MLPAKAKAPATYADLEALPPHQVGELIDGELVVSPRPAAPHAYAASRLGVGLGPYGTRGGGGPGGWIILDEPELHVAGQVLVPDLAGWRRERLPAALDAIVHFDVAPDWVCEVLSPSTVVVDRTRKWRHYARAGVAHLWFVDPIPRLLEVYARDGESWRLRASHAGDEKVRAEPFDAIELDLAELWLW